MHSSMWRATAPSNIALIKYMGKLDVRSSDLNRPTNASISYTLNDLQSLVELHLTDGPERWEPLTAAFDGRALDPIQLTEKGAQRFMAHLALIKNHFGVRQNFIVRSANDFPSDCGLASSASSFAALTKAALAAVCQLSDRQLPSLLEQANWSRQGSGSSCRSFFAPWAMWDSEGAREAAGLPYRDLLHQAIVVDDTKKTVSSSAAHVRVASSLLFNGRTERAERRMKELTEALKHEEWASAFEITWAEFWDMHALFETAQPSFSYMTSGSLEVLRWVRAENWEKHGDGPLVTMDAGANVHLLYRDDDFGRRSLEQTAARWQGRFKVFSRGAKPR